MKKILGDRWLWLMDVMFGGVAILAFQRLIDSTISISSLSVENIIVMVFGAISVFIFFIYDVTVLHFLYIKYPYNLTWLSAIRLLIDLVMVFLLALITIPVMNHTPHSSTALVLTAISFWHVFAIFWHLVAEYELNKRPPVLKQVLQHLINPVVYWVLATALILCSDSQVSFESYNKISVFVVVCLAIVVASIIRASTLISRMSALGE